MGVYSSFYELNAQNVDWYVSEEIGNYRICYYNSKDGKYYIQYVGRDDVNVNRRLKEHVAAVEAGNEPSGYTHFQFMIQTCKTDAYRQECEDYHKYEKFIYNQRHPQKPDGMNCKCPKVDCPHHQ